MALHDVEILDPGVVPLPPELERSHPEPPDSTPEPEPVTPGAEVATLTADDIARINATPACRHCGGRHARACPRVRRLAFHSNGQLAEVEFWPDGRWSDDYVIWPEQVPDPDGG